MSLNPIHGEVYLIQHYVIKFVSDLRQVGGFLWFNYSTNKTDHHDITEILLKVTLNTINQKLERNTEILNKNLQLNHLNIKFHTLYISRVFNEMTKFPRNYFLI